jgi:hypothetical protein
LTRLPGGLLGGTIQELPGWLDAVEAHDLPELRSLATGMRRDLPAIINGLTLKHSSGAVEGNVTRVKKIKRDSPSGAQKPVDLAHEDYAGRQGRAIRPYRTHIVTAVDIRSVLLLSQRLPHERHRFRRTLRCGGG